MEESTFRMKNDIGVEIEYTEIARITLDKEYMLYTDFVPEDNNVGFRILVAEVTKDGLIEIRDKRIRETIIRGLNNQLLSVRNNE